MSKRMDANPWRNYIRVVFEIGFLAGSLALSMYLFSPIIGLVLWSPIFGFVANRWVIDGASRLLAWRKARVLGPLNGRYYAFDGIPVTVEWSGDSIRVLADDVFRMLDFKADDSVRRKLALRCGADGFYQDTQGRWWFGEEALLDFISCRTQGLDAQALRLHRWFEKQVFMPLHRKHENKKL